MDYVKLTKKIIKDKLNVEVTSIEERSKGVDNIVFIINIYSLAAELRSIFYVSRR